MKIPVNNIHCDLDIAIKGDEPWLETIYEYFPTPPAKAQPKIEAQLKLMKFAAGQGTLRVSGRLQYAPYVSCSRCSDKILWPVDCTFDCVFGPQPEQVSDQEATLRDEDCNYFHYQNGEIDIELLLNEMIQSEVPLQTIQLQENSDDCGVCGREPLSASSSLTDRTESGPFAALKALLG